MTTFPRVPTDLDLLTLQRRWTTDLDSPAADSEVVRGVRLVASAATGRWTVLPGSTLPEAAVTAIGELLASVAPGSTPSPAVVDAVRRSVEGDAPPRVEGGAVYLFPERVPFATPAGHALITSADGASHRLREARPASWEPDEWERLLTGEGAPWAAALVDGQVVSLCHTPKPLLAPAAECGVWTHPRSRGRHLAVAVTAAWAGVAAGAGRHLFYRHDHRNEASRRVAERLGLRHLGWEWTIAAEPWAEGDAWGDALVDHLLGRWVPTPELEVEGGAVGDAMHPSWFFRTFEAWDWWERELLPLAVRSPALDLGAGAGRVSLWLQERGVEVTAIDSSPGAVEVCVARGVGDARLGDLNDPPADRRWRAIFLLCGNLGLGGSFAGNRRLLTRLAEVAAPDAVLVGDSVEPGGEPDVGLRIRYRHAATPWWRQRNVPADEVGALVRGTGWVLDRHVVDLPDHAVVLRRA